MKRVRVTNYNDWVVVECNGHRIEGHEIEPENLTEFILAHLGLKYDTIKGTAISYEDVHGSYAEFTVQ